MNILDKIIEAKHQEVKTRKELYPFRLLEQSIWFSSPTVSMTSYLLRADKSGIIAEFKRKSPSKGMINPYATVEKTTIGYMQAGASALSVLTDQTFFGGTNADLTTARKFNFCPIIRKDFIIDPYQILEARSIGADAILLIAAVLDKASLKEYTGLAHSLGLQVLLEVHDEMELAQSIESGADMIGVNNRDLKTFEVSLEVSHRLANLIPTEFVKVSESGINTPEDILALRKSGFAGFLMGEHFMRSSSPEKAARAFIQKLNLIHE